MSCTSIGDKNSPSCLASNIPCTLIKHSFNGCGPGALPPDVTNRAPLALISEKSNFNFDVP